MSARKNPVRATKDAVTAVAHAVGDAVAPPHVPGVPASQPPSLEEPTTPRDPLPPKPDQREPAPFLPTGKDTGAPPTARAQACPYLTTAQGVRVPDTDHSLKAGPRGPVLLQDRLSSYLDTQLSRLGGPNFSQIPVNRPHAPVNDMLRDGFHQQAVHGGAAPYRPNTLDGGNPFEATTEEGAFVEVPAPVAASQKVRQAPQSFDDRTSQARMFWLSMTPVEQAHIVQSFTFELGKVYEQTIKERELLVLANVDAGLCAAVAAGLGCPPRKPPCPRSTWSSARPCPSSVAPGRPRAA